MFVHVFLYVVSRKDDPFVGIKSQLNEDKQGQHVIKDLKLSAKCYQIIAKTEYSDRRVFRLFIYRKVFAELEKSLESALDDYVNQPTIVYLADDGVWAEFLEKYKNKYKKRFISVNIQHGYFDFHPTKSCSLKIRKTINSLSTRFVGYPIFGLGYFASDAFDAYIVYGETEKDYLVTRNISNIYVCPQLIKKQFINRFLSAEMKEKTIGKGQRRILFALPFELKWTMRTCSLIEIFKEITPVAKYLLRKNDVKLVIRPHPGAGLKSIGGILARCELAEYVDIDQEEDVAASISRCIAVMGYNSTVLFEAFMVGKIPVNVLGGCGKVEPNFPHEKVNIKEMWQDQIDMVLDEKTALRYRLKAEVQLDIDWANQIGQFF